MMSSLSHTAASCDDRRHGDAAVHDRDAVLGLDGLGDRHELLGTRADQVVDFRGAALDVGVGALVDAHAERDGADIEILLGDHQQRLDDLLGRDVHVVLRMSEGFGLRQVVA